MIYIIHGVVCNWNPERISHGLMLSESALTRHLQERPTKYVPLAEALLGNGDALTVDDATYAGLQAALLARKHGHSVSWFVNGLNVERGLPYFPFELSWMLDVTEKVSCCFDGQHWDLSDPAGRRILRLHLKQAYLRMRGSEEIADLIKTFSGCVEVAASTLDLDLRTVTPMDLAYAAKAGVDLQNHGWTHLNPELLSERELAADVQLNGAYLASFRKTNLRIFAPPFGRQLAVDPCVASYVLLADRSYIFGRQNQSTVNRYDLHLPMLLRSSFTRFNPVAASRVSVTK